MHNSLEVTNKFHLGVYGILLKNDFILLVKKGRGPYTGKLDLPGGKPEHGEAPNQTLAREILEETGVKTLASKLFDNYSTVVEELIRGNAKERTHHMGLLYLILAYDETMLVPYMNIEDSLGAQWYQLEGLTEDTLSPFAYEAIKNIKKLHHF